MYSEHFRVLLTGDEVDVLMTSIKGSIRVPQIIRGSLVSCNIEGLGAEFDKLGTLRKPNVQGLIKLSHSNRIGIVLWEISLIVDSHIRKTDRNQISWIDAIIRQPHIQHIKVWGVGHTCDSAIGGQVQRGTHQVDGIRGGVRHENLVQRMGRRIQHVHAILPPFLVDMWPESGGKRVVVVVVERDNVGVVPEEASAGKGTVHVQMGTYKDQSDTSWSARLGSPSHKVDKDVCLIARIHSDRVESVSSVIGALKAHAFIGAGESQRQEISSGRNPRKISESGTHGIDDTSGSVMEESDADEREAVSSAHILSLKGVSKGDGFECGLSEHIVI